MSAVTAYDVWFYPERCVELNPPIDEIMRGLGASEDVIEYVFQIEDSRLRGMAFNEVRKMPLISLPQLQATVGARPKERQPTKQEASAVRYISHGVFDRTGNEQRADEFEAWAAIQLMKHRSRDWTELHQVYDVYGGEERGLVGFYFTEEGQHQVPKLDEIADWFVDQNIRIATYDWQQAVDASDEWHRACALKGVGQGYEASDDHEVISWPDGWRIVSVGSESNMEVEGTLMKHCVASYWPSVAAGRLEIYSLRDPRNQPHVTMEVSKEKDVLAPQGEGLFVFNQVKGVANTKPKPAYAARIKQWVESLPKQPVWANADELTPRDVILNSPQLLDDMYNALTGRTKGEAVVDEYGIATEQFKLDFYNIGGDLDAFIKDAFHRNQHMSGEDNDKADTYGRLLFYYDLEKLGKKKKFWSYSVEAQKFTGHTVAASGLAQLSDYMNDDQNTFDEYNLDWDYEDRPEEPDRDDFKSEKAFKKAYKEYEEALQKHDDNRADALYEQYQSEGSGAFLEGVFDGYQAEAGAHGVTGLPKDARASQAKNPTPPQHPSRAEEERLTFKQGLSPRQLQQAFEKLGHRTELGDFTANGGDLILLDRQPVGWLYQDDMGVLEAFEIFKEFRGQGIGKAALQALYEGQPFRAFLANEQGMALLRSYGAVSAPDQDGYVRVTGLPRDAKKAKNPGDAFLIEHGLRGAIKRDKAGWSYKNDYVTGDAWSIHEKTKPGLQAEILKYKAEILKGQEHRERAGSTYGKTYLDVGHRGNSGDKAWTYERGGHLEIQLTADSPHMGLPWVWQGRYDAKDNTVSITAPVDQEYASVPSALSDELESAFPGARIIQFNTGPSWKGPAYRGGPDSAMPSGKTALDVVRYEIEELGNTDLQVLVSEAELAAIPARELEWLTKSKKVAAEYGPVQKVELPDDAQIIAQYDDGGFLVRVMGSENPPLERLQGKPIPEAILSYLHYNNNGSTKELADAIGENPKAIYKELQKLESLGLVFRDEQEREKGKYSFLRWEPKYYSMIGSPSSAGYGSEEKLIDEYMSLSRSQNPEGKFDYIEGRYEMANPGKGSGRLDWLKKYEKEHAQFIEGGKERRARSYTDYGMESEDYPSIGHGRGSAVWYWDASGDYGFAVEWQPDGIHEDIWPDVPFQEGLTKLFKGRFDPEGETGEDDTPHPVVTVVGVGQYEIPVKLRAWLRGQFGQDAEIISF